MVTLLGILDVKDMGIFFNPERSFIVSRFKSKLLILTVILSTIVQKTHCKENGNEQFFPREKHNSLIEISKILGGALLLFSGTGMVILADSPKCDKESPILGPCFNGESHPTRNKIVGGSLITGGAGLVIWGIVNLADNVHNDN